MSSSEQINEIIMAGGKYEPGTKLTNEELKVQFMKKDKENIQKQKEESYVAKKINWLDDPEFENWEQTKTQMRKTLRSGEKMFFLAHTKDSITGKPQLISDVKQTIPLIVETEKNDGNTRVTTYKFIDDKFDRRYDGFEKDSFDETFYVYRVIDQDQEYVVFHKEKLEPEMYTFKGMAVKMSIIPDLTKSLKMRSIAKIFFSKEAISTVRLMSKEELIEFTKYLKEEINLDQEGFRNLTFLHPDGKIYLHTESYNLIRIAQLLSGKFEGYPLSIMNMGPLAKGKTKELEALDYKFREQEGICEAGNSTPKKLVPSYKEKPASPGYILNCYRIALIDELMKMVSNANSGTRDQELVKGALGQLNMILEHKKRTIGSGNDNSFIAKATAKVLIQTNPLHGKKTLAQHLSLIDDTTLSRLLCVVQNEEEQKFIETNKPFKCGDTYLSIYTQNEGGLYYWKGVPTSFYVLIYDNCQNFLSNLNEEKAREIYQKSLNLVNEPMKSIWKGRGFHHSVLLLDGLIKYRCLFKDYDSTFTATEEDYQKLEGLLTNIVLSWKTDLSPKDSESWRSVK